MPNAVLGVEQFFEKKKNKAICSGMCLPQLERSEAINILIGDCVMKNNKSGSGYKVLRRLSSKIGQSLHPLK